MGLWQFIDRHFVKQRKRLKVAKFILALLAIVSAARFAALQIFSFKDADGRIVVPAWLGGHEWLEQLGWADVIAIFLYPIPIVALVLDGVGWITLLGVVVAIAAVLKTLWYFSQLIATMLGVSSIGSLWRSMASLFSTDYLDAILQLGLGVSLATATVIVIIIAMETGAPSSSGRMRDDLKYTA